MRFDSMRSVALAIPLLLAACTARPPALPPGVPYVAMGSSFAAGPGLPPYEGDAPARCSRSTRNYAHQLAAKRGLALVDVSCSGASTGAVLDGWNELPAQVAAIGSATKLVTVTIGGNDVGYIGSMMSLSCQTRAARAGTPPTQCRAPAWPDEAAFERLTLAMDRIGAAVRTRAPDAILVFVDYPVVLPQSGICEATPLPPADADRLRQVGQRLQKVTAAAARRAGALLLTASDLSRGHDACAPSAWMVGFPAPAGAAPYHPNLAGMTAIAEALDRILPR